MEIKKIKQTSQVLYYIFYECRLFDISRNYLPKYETHYRIEYSYYTIVIIMNNTKL